MMQHFTDDSRYFQEDSIKCQNLTFKVAEGFLLRQLGEKLRGVRHWGKTTDAKKKTSKHFLIRRDVFFAVSSTWPCLLSAISSGGEFGFHILKILEYKLF